MGKKTIILFSCMLSVFFAEAQLRYELTEGIQVTQENKILTNPFAGGFNSVIVNMMDYTGDGREDLILYERTTGKVKTFIAEGSQWKFDPLGNNLFPEITDWMLLRDFNQDGKKDLFTSHPLGISLFVNDSKGNTISWRPFNNGQALETAGVSGSINIYNGQTDLPSISDVNGDGLLDIITFGFLSNTFEYNQNVAGTPDTLVFKRISDKWGEIEECGCGLYSNTISCQELLGGKVEHFNSRTLLATDADGDGDTDLIMGEEGCTYINFLENTGTNENAYLQVSSKIPAFEFNGIYSFPACYIEDIDHDGKKDFIISSYSTSNFSYYMNFRINFAFHKNYGTNEQPDYRLIQRNYLQDEMIEVGENSHPVFEDFDNDGDLDMIIGRQTDIVFEGRSSSLYLYENTGNASEPEFILRDNDFLGLSSFTFFNIKPQLADVNNDQNIDLIFTANSGNNGEAELFYVLNPSFFTLQTDPVYLNPTGFTLAIADQPYFYDLDNDNDLDLLMGASDGTVYFAENQGNKTLGDFDITDNDFYDISTSGYSGRPKIEIADLDNSGFPDLLVYGGERVELYRDFMENPSAEEEILIDYNNKQVNIDRNLPFINKLTVVNLFDEDQPSIVIGTREGGIHLLRNTDAISKATNDFMTVKPNPGTTDFVEFDSNRKIIVQVYTMKGQKVSGDIKIRSEEDFQYFVKDLAGGAYYARIFYDDEYFEVKKFIVL